jgi:hypothetical protein
MSLESRIEKQIREKAKKDEAYKNKFLADIARMESKQNKTDSEKRALEITKQALKEIS